MAQGSASSSASSVRTRVAVVFLWQFVWFAGLLVALVAFAPVTAGGIAHLIGYRFIVFAVGLVAIAATAYAAMGLVQRGDPTPRAWVAPTIMNAAYVVYAVVAARNFTTLLVLVFAVSAEAGVWLRVGTSPGSRPRLQRTIAACSPALVVAALGVLLVVVGVQYFSMATNADAPKLRTGDIVVSSMHTSELRTGDYVVLNDPQIAGRLLIRRVGGLAGQTVVTRSGESTVVPSAHLWLISSGGSGQPDSTNFGAEPLSAVQGKVFAIIWPLSRAQIVQ